MKARRGLMSASKGAERLGISRKTYYKREQPVHSTRLTGLTDQTHNRPSQPVGRNNQALEKQLQQVRQDNELLKKKWHKRMYRRT